MRTTIFISDNQIRIVNAKFANRKLKAKRVISLPLKDGVIEDGLIKNEEEFSRTLYNFKTASPELLKDTILVLDSRHTITKKIDIPKLTKKQIELTVQNEMFELAESYGELNADYSLLSNKKILLCCAIQKKIADDYDQIFMSHGIKLKKIDIGINAIIKLAQKIKEFKNKTFVINIIHSNNILSLLFENNNYVLSIRMKINEPRNSEKYIDDVYNKLSTFMQFNKAQKSEFQINYSYYSGLVETEIEKLREINTYENIEIIDLKDVFNINTKHNPSNFIFNVAALLEQKKDINLLTDKKTDIEKKKSKFSTSILSIIFLIAVVIGAITFLNSYRDIQNLDADLNKVNLYVKDGTNKSAYDQAEKTKKMLDEIKKTNKSIDEFEKSLSNKFILSSDKFNKIFSVCEESVSISALVFSSENNSLTLEAKAVNPSDIINFVSRLRGTNIFLKDEEGITYDGYKLDSATQVYNFKVKCKLKVGGSDE